MSRIASATARSEALTAGDLRAIAFRKAARHSRRVRFLRRALPTFVIGVLVIAALWIWLDPLRFARHFPFDLSRISLSGNRLTMEAPKLTGFTRDGRAFTISANAASQDLTQLHIVELTDIQAHLLQADRGKIELTAKTGIYDSKTEQVHLTGGIQIRAPGGYEGRLKDAIVEGRKGHVVSENPVEVTFTDGSLRGNRIEIYENGERILIEGDVIMIFRLPPPKDQAANKGTER
jgi:lipopolysaccharide export system protein LptC